MAIKGRAACLVVRNRHILMVRHRLDGMEWLCLPGGGIESGETPEQAAKRELQEECLVTGANLKLISVITHERHQGYTFYADIGSQEPALGVDPEFVENPVLVGVEWHTLDSICERDRAYLWASGLFCVEAFEQELSNWGDDISYPAPTMTDSSQ